MMKRLVLGIVLVSLFGIVALSASIDSVDIIKPQEGDRLSLGEAINFEIQLISSEDLRAQWMTFRVRLIQVEADGVAAETRLYTRNQRPVKRQGRRGNYTYTYTFSLSLRDELPAGDYSVEIRVLNGREELATSRTKVELVSGGNCDVRSTPPELLEGKSDEQIEKIVENIITKKLFMVSFLLFIDTRGDVS